MCSPAPNRRRVLRYFSAFSLLAACTPKASVPADSTAPDDSDPTGDSLPDDSGHTGDSEVSFDPAIPADKAAYCDQGAQAVPDACTPMLEAGEGPFYRSDIPERQNLNPRGDGGTLILLTGRVLDASTCQPVAGAEVVIWHANVDENYDMSPDYQCYGRTFTASDGSFCFYGTLPIPYPDGTGQSYLAAHYHYKVTIRGQVVLTSQMWFEGDPYLAGFEPPEMRLNPMPIGENLVQARIDIPVIVPA